MRYSILHLFITVAVVGLAATSLKFANEQWWTVLSSAGLLLFLALAVVAIAGHSQLRWFAAGFITCGAIYGCVLHSFAVNNMFEDLPTSALLDFCHGFVVSEIPAAEISDPALAYLQMGGPMVDRKPDISDFIFVGHMWIGFLLGWLGGLFACWFRRTS